MAEIGRSKTSLGLVREGCPAKAKTQVSVGPRVTVEKGERRKEDLMPSDV